RELAQQLDDRRLDRIHDRPPRLACVARRLVRPQRVAHRVASHPETTRDGLDAQLLGAMQPTNLGPILHTDHPPVLLARIEPGSESKHQQWWTRPAEGQFSTGDRGSVFTRW